MSRWFSRHLLRRLVARNAHKLGPRLNLDVHDSPAHHSCARHVGILHSFVRTNVCTPGIVSSWGYPFTQLASPSVAVGPLGRLLVTGKIRCRGNMRKDEAQSSHEEDSSTGGLPHLPRVMSGISEGDKDHLFFRQESRVLRGSGNFVGTESILRSRVDLRVYSLQRRTNDVVGLQPKLKG